MSEDKTEEFTVEDAIKTAQELIGTSDRFILLTPGDDGKGVYHTSAADQQFWADSILAMLLQAEPDVVGYILMAYNDTLDAPQQKNIEDSTAIN